ncbi:MAG: phosphoglucosamine mutase [Acidimicrobiaceae bacterium]|nr:phosphoglucosamine mutase [Acidimicrobiaceae bacterium]MDE0516913.1 phosphoglucosamine mutase [Acidimicrobiaceae bacterium]MDE0656312.1 phosphoglucosamine mutase [Acidimicrobiaceae bacterium]MXZ95382.1 phosphoglucosamine mutase [Acidimicrobiaceae bacterium]MYF44677.1 phosphoglucosamine mutase [Acidimicrobiaceae bacterium]
MSLTFGTDGVRGDARRELTPEFVEALGRAAASVLGAERFAVGRDTRVSGPPLAEALRRGVQRAGGAAVDLGVVPTPAVARWCDDEQVAGAVISASHNPWHDNGVKLFAPGGRKLSDQAQDSIERRLAAADGGAGPVPETGSSRPVGTPPGDSAGDLARRRHVQAVAASLKGRDLAGLRIVVDAANGAACGSAPDCLRALRAEVETIHAEPDGYNINDGCGSLHPESLQAAVVSSRADAGLAFDGDADRVLAVDGRGTVVDGDQILAVCAIDRAQRGRLAGNAVVVTVMSNLGLRQAMAACGIDVVETPVGDRHVLEALEERGLVLGGEQSGHLIFRDLATTGDGLLTAVQLLDTVMRSGNSLHDVAAGAMTRLPQVLVGVPMSPAAAPADLEAALGPIAAAAESRLGGSGRVLVRPSGTEPLVRVMVEAVDLETARSEADQLAADVGEALSCP